MPVCSWLYVIDSNLPAVDRWHVISRLPRAFGGCNWEIGSASASANYSENTKRARERTGLAGNPVSFMEKLE